MRMMWRVVVVVLLVEVVRCWREEGSSNSRPRMVVDYLNQHSGILTNITHLSRYEMDLFSALVKIDK